MLSLEAQQLLVNAVQKVPSLNGSMVGLHDNYDNLSSLLHGGDKSTQAYFTKFVIVEISSNDSEMLINSLETLAIDPKAAAQQRFSGELGKTLISCGFMGISIAGVMAGAAAEPITGGLSTALVVFAWTNVITSGFQCADGLFKTFMAATGQLDTLRSLESGPGYKVFMEFVSWVDVGASLGTMGVKGFAKGQLIKRLKNQLAVGFNNLSGKAKIREIYKSLQHINKSPEGKQLIRQSLKDAGYDDLKINQFIAQLQHSNGSFVKYVAKGGSAKTYAKNSVIVPDILAKEAEILTKHINEIDLILNKDIDNFVAQKAAESLFNKTNKYSITIHIVSV